MTDHNSRLEKQIAKAIISRACIRTTGRLFQKPETIVLHSKAAKLFAALHLFYIARQGKTLDECAWDEPVKNWTKEDFWATEYWFLERTWLATVADPKLVSYAHYVNGF